MLRMSGGRRLQSPPGSLARPTPARVRLAVMNMLAPRLAGAAWLDLCSGSGVMACEALRRGAGRVVAVERDRRIAAVAQANLAAVATERQTPGGQTPERQTPEPASSPLFELHTREVLAWLAQSAGPQNRGPGQGRRGQPGPVGGSQANRFRERSLLRDAYSVQQAGQERREAFDLIYADPPYRAGLHAPIAAAVAAGGWLRPEGLLLLECASDELPSLDQTWHLLESRRYGGTTVLLLRRASAAQGTAAAVLVPGRHEEPHQGHWNQSEHDAAEEGFDHGPQTVGQSGHNLFMSPAPIASPRHQP